MNLKLPQNLKFKKYNKKFIYKKGTDLKCSDLFFGSSCGLVALEGGRLTLEQIKTCLLLLSKLLNLKRKYKNKLMCSLIIRAPLTAKSLGSRMGRGKGAISQWICYVRPGRVLFQIQSAKRQKISIFALKKIMYKLPILTKIVVKQPLFYCKFLG